jgi:hypothetical protein
MSWGKGGMVGVRKAIWQHEQVQRQAAEILAIECGTRHETGTRPDLCPKCKQARTEARATPEERTR